MVCLFDVHALSVRCVFDKNQSCVFSSQTNTGITLFVHFKNISHTHTQMHIHTCTHTGMHACMHTYAHMHTHARTHTQTCSLAFTDVDRLVMLLLIKTHIFMLIKTHIFIFGTDFSVCSGTHLQQNRYLRPQTRISSKIRSR